MISHVWAYFFSVLINYVANYDIFSFSIISDERGDWSESVDTKKSKSPKSRDSTYRQSTLDMSSRDRLFSMVYVILIQTLYIWRHSRRSSFRTVAVRYSLSPNFKWHKKPSLYVMKFSSDFFALAQIYSLPLASRQGIFINFFSFR